MKRTTVQLLARLVGVAVGVAGLAGCGGDAGISIAIATPKVTVAQVHGTVQMPNGKVAAGPQSPLQRFAAVLLPEAEALSGNVSPVGAGVSVLLVLLHADGSQDPPAGSTTTDAQGQYSMQLPPQTGPDTCRYVVEVGSGASLTRAFVTTTSNTEDIDYASEAAVRLVLNNVSAGDNLCNYTSSQLDSLVISIRSISGDVSGANAAEVNDKAFTFAANHVPPLLPSFNTPTARATAQPATPTVPASTPTSIPGTTPPTPAPTTPSIAATVTPTQMPTATPVPAPCTPPAIQFNTFNAVPGTQVTISATLRAGGSLVAGTQNDLVVDPNILVNSKSNGKPDCAVNPNLLTPSGVATEKGATSFVFRPNGCTGAACTTVRALVVATDNTDPIADNSVLYTCAVNVAAAANTTYPLAVSGVVLSDPLGGKVANASGCNGAIVAGTGPTLTPTLGATFTPTTTPTATVPGPTLTPTLTATNTATPTDTVPPPNTATPTVTDTPGGPTMTATATATITPVFTDTPAGGGPTPTLVPLTCQLGGGTGALLGSQSFVLNLPLTGGQVWRFGALQPDSTRPIVIEPSESHFDCATTSLVGMSVKICARVDPTTYCHGGANDGQACPPAVCGADGVCAVNPGTGVVDCAPAGGNITNYNTLVQIDHDTNAAAFGTKPNLGFAADPDCTATFAAPDGSVLQSCIEPEYTPAATVTTGPGTPTPSPRPTPTARAVAAATCTGSMHSHPNVCNSPTLQTSSGGSPVGGFRLHEGIDLAFEIGKDCAVESCFNAVGTCSGGATAGASCAVDGDCGSGGTCSTRFNICTGGTAAGSKCHMDADCAGGGTCAAKTCNGGKKAGGQCGSNSDCPGKCSGGPTPDAQCAQTTDCGTGGTCSLGTCVLPPNINGTTCSSNADCSGFDGQVTPGVCSVCPPDNTPLQDGELQLAGDITSGQTKGVIWNLNNTALILGTTGDGTGVNICGTLLGGPKCPSVATGTAFDLSGIGGDCTTHVPPTATGAAVALAYPALDFPTIGDFIATLTLQCQ